MAVSAASVMGPARWEDWIELPKDDCRELIDGVLTAVEVPTKVHEHVVAMLVYHLVSWAKPRKTGLVVTSGYKVRISQERGVMPDVQFFRTENARNLPSEGLTSGRPDLVIEVVSETSRRYDRVTKLGWYASIGVPEYWIVDSQGRTFERLILHEGNYRIVDALADDTLFRPSSFEGLEIPLNDLWIVPGEE